VPVVIWHGLGDRHDAEGMLSLKASIEDEFGGDVFVHLVKIEEDGEKDQRATFFGSANAQVELVCSQLHSIPELVSPSLNPNLTFDAIGFSQGGQLLRAVVERCTSPKLRVRNLITVGSQHMGVNALPPCESGPNYALCKLMSWLARSGVYSSYAQREILPAQYFRNEAELEKYWAANHFLKDINNEREGDGHVESFGSADEKRNETYKENLLTVNNFVMFNFTKDQTVSPPASSFFTLPDPSAPFLPLPLSRLPLYSEDYIGLKQLHDRDSLWFGTCDGFHMQIDEACWNQILSWLGPQG
ncbi:alpha/beta-hydrolase, partial [Atractiella rhizophila]